MNDNPKKARHGYRAYAQLTPSPWLLVCMIVLACNPFSRQAGAADVQLSQASPLPTILTPGVVSAPQDAPYNQFDALKIKGWNIPLPSAGDTVDGNAFGLRDALADLGIGYILFTLSYDSDNVLRHGLPVGSRQNQLYSGQLPTLYSSNFAYLTYDLSRYGIPNGQILLGGIFLKTNWTPLGPSDTSLSEATYYQTLFNKKVEIKIGYIANSLEFFGTYVGGSLAGGVFGPNGSIPVEQGQSSTVYPTPGVDVTLHLFSDFYSKLGVQRAQSPDGVTVENVQDAAGVRFTVPNAGVWVIDETGYRVAASAGVPQTWIRASASYTSSKYQDLSKPGLRSDDNYGLYIFGDHQFWQSAPYERTAARGLYAGFTVEYAPPALNRFSQYYEARLYGFGLIPRRPRDLLSVVATRNVFSSYAVDTAIAERQLAHRSTEALTVAYSAHVLPGININTGVSYVDHPTSVTYTRLIGSALNILFGAVAFF